MTPAALLQLVISGLGVAIPTLQAILRPFLHARVRVKVRIEVDGPGNLDPIVDVDGAGFFSVDGFRVDGEPSIKVGNASKAGDS